MTNLWTDEVMSDYVDEFSIVFASNPDGSYLKPEQMKRRVADLEKTSTGFKFPEDYREFFDAVTKNTRKHLESK